MYLRYRSANETEFVDLLNEEGATIRFTEPDAVMSTRADVLFAKSQRRYIRSHVTREFIVSCRRFGGEIQEWSDLPGMTILWAGSIYNKGDTCLCYSYSTRLSIFRTGGLNRALPGLFIRAITGSRDHVRGPGLLGLVGHILASGGVFRCCLCFVCGP